jgi:hypothetical protein
MDLFFRLKAARTAVIRILTYSGVTLLLWTGSSHGDSAHPDRDYLFESESRGGQIVTQSRLTASDGSAKKSTNIQYRAFDGKFHHLREHRGRYVSVLLPPAAGGGLSFTPDHIEEMLDRLDILYVLYRELLHVEPAGNGLLKIAFVPETCGMGCGLIGSKGIEILSDPVNYLNIIRELDAGRLETILVHEMVHNFDTWSQYLHYLPDHAHAWTDMFEFFAPYRFARDSLKNESPDEVYDSSIRAVWKQYVTDENADWETCVRDLGCEDAGLTANNLWAMPYYRIENLYGIEALLASFEFIADYSRKRPPPRTVQEKEGLRILSLSVGAGVNLACDMDSLKWTVPQEVRTELQNRFGDASPDCGDSDLDGFSVVNGDCDDNDPSRHILSRELAGNGLDDDCDEFIDEDILIEADRGHDPDNFVTTVDTRLPFEVKGSASDTTDRDRFRFDLTQTGRVRVTLCATENFRGWAAALQPNGAFLDAPDWFTYRPQPGCSSVTTDFGAHLSGTLEVIADDSHGPYTLTVSEAEELPPDHSVYLKVEPRVLGGVTLRVNDRDGLMAGLGADEVEFWISGTGLQIFRPFSTGMAVHLDSASHPQLANGGLYQARIRLRANGKPITGFSAGQLFRYEAGFNEPVVVDDRYSGAWFDPGHKGEGLVVEVLEGDRALVYWFTYHADGSQRWLLGTGSLRDGRLEVGELSDTEGGRFGDDFEPDDVKLKTRGSLSITFLSCSRALLNYNVDNNGGHQALERLTVLAGHGCARLDSPLENELSGSWYDPAHEGEGFIVQQLDARRALVLWFTYNDSGKQSWLLNTGNIDDGQISFPEMLQPLGGVFGRSFDPADVTRNPWGELILKLECDGGLAEYRSTLAGYSDGTQQLERLSRLQNSFCH